MTNCLDILAFILSNTSVFVLAQSLIEENGWELKILPFRKLLASLSLTYKPKVQAHDIINRVKIGSKMLYVSAEIQSIMLKVLGIC